MLPTELKREQFTGYPPQAAQLVSDYLDALRRLPLSFLPSMLREWIEYDYKFPAERAAIDAEIANIRSLSPAQISDWFAGFAQLRLSPALEQTDWIHQPGQFVEQLSAYLWSTHQMDSYHEAATAYADRLAKLSAPSAPPMPRLGIAIIGQGVASYDAPLFRKLRVHGTYFTQVDPRNGVDALLEAAARRAEAHPLPYAHWYVDGGATTLSHPQLTAVSYQGLAPTRDALLRNIERETAKPGMGPEQLRTHMAQLTPAELSMRGDAVLDRFQLKLLTEGSGTQIFSTTFAQWAAREALRRAQALTLVVRFAPRQRQRPMNELLASGQGTPEVDPAGSLVDADMAAYYQWINQQRLPGSERSSFVAWFEDHAQAVAISPHLPRGTESASKVDLASLLALATG